MKIRLGLRKKTDAVQVILVLAVLMEILLWARMNLMYQYVMDHDAAKLFYHVICMWREKTLIIPDWIYTTTGEWDCASLPALLFYGLTKDIKLSFGMANVCNILLFSYVISRVFRTIPSEQGGRKGMLLAICVLLMPYCWGMLDYANMLFYGGAQYIYKVLLPVWLLSLYVGMPDKTPLAVLYTAGFFALEFATATSSGVYVLACGLFPILCCRFIRTLGVRKQHFDRKGLWISVGTVLVYIAGFLFQKAENLTSRIDIMSISSLENLLPGNALQVLKDFLSVMQVIPTWDFLELFSFEGIISYLKIGMLFVMAVLVWGELPHCFLLGTAFKAPEQMQDGARFVKAGLCTVFAWNLFIVLLTESRPRYHLIGFIPFVILACILLAEKLEECLLPLLKKFLWTGIALAAMLLSAMLFVDARDQVTNVNERHAKVIIAEAEAQDVQTVVVVDEGGLTELIRPLDPDRDYVTYFTSAQKLINYAAPGSYNDMSLLEGRHMLVAQSHYPFENLPESMKANYTLIRDEWGTQYYISESADN